MVTDVYNGVKLALGPNVDHTTNQTLVLEDGVIRKAHPILGGFMLGRPFLPMLVVPLALVEGGFCFGMVTFLICGLPFTVFTTPAYIIAVIFMGYRGVLKHKIGKILTTL